MVLSLDWKENLKQHSLRFETNKNPNARDIFKKREDEVNISFTNLTINKNDTGFFIQLKFEDIDYEKSIELLNALQKDPEINKTYWNK